LQTNETAQRLYLKLGFRVRREIDVVVAQWHDDGLPADATRENEDRGAAAALPDPTTRR
jgi:ribosomal protein S18 acetylase RimI-like enzyme